MSEARKLQHRTWSKDNYVISTDPALISVQKLNKAFASKDVYWALPMPDEVMREMLQQSLCFGLYNTELQPEKDQAASKGGEGKEEHKFGGEMELVGIARLVTDFTTFAYLTDVYVWPTHQGKGLGKWLIGRVQEVLEEMPYLRRSLLFTGDWERSVPFYRKIIGMELVGSKERDDGGPAVMQWKGSGFPSRLYVREEE